MVAQIHESTNWPEVRFRYLADFHKGRLPSSSAGGAGGDQAAYLSMEYLRGGEGTAPTLVPVDPGVLWASDGDILLLWDGSNAGEFLRARRGIVSSTTALVKPKSADSTFFYWACKAQETQLRAETVGMGIPHVDGEFLADLRIPLPSARQQRVISHYLDRETTRLDSLVAEKERVLNLLAERRRALITRAVTRGLDPDRAPPVLWCPLAWRHPGTLGNRTIEVAVHGARSAFHYGRRGSAHRVTPYWRHPAFTKECNHVRGSDKAGIQDLPLW